MPCPTPATRGPAPPTATAATTGTASPAAATPVSARGHPALPPLSVPWALPLLALLPLPWPPSLGTATPLITVLRALPPSPSLSPGHCHPHHHPQGTVTLPGHCHLLVTVLRALPPFLSLSPGHCPHGTATLPGDTPSLRCPQPCPSSCPGYFGDSCVSACALNPCQSPATCARKPGSVHGYTCECPQGHFGPYCEHK